ncbi:hypothetical protein BJP34_35655 (plasmid) [Moorena producens PAL-8-15-08-1]|uniref:Uncharacterized protein n=1 Tax=Moorena producens PAL-8-15-08-1 TaxID=1458985 RepID=A0A1D8U4B9_9CYAN|nr:hypothetical protein BJP34_35655 [Moorena producens PAL-8-15-08-1]
MFFLEFKRLFEKSHLLHPSPLNLPILGDFYKQFDSCLPPKLGVQNSVKKKLVRYPPNQNSGENSNIEG